MAGPTHLGDLDLTALISSRICHDVISPVGAIANGLEVLDEEHDDQVREYALDLIRRSADQASAKLQFARLAFGAAGSAGTEIGLPQIEDVSQGILDPEKHKVEFTSKLASLSKDKVKLLLNMFAIAITALPRGGRIAIDVSGDINAPSIKIACEGEGARMPERFHDLMVGNNGFELDSMSIQAYYTVRMAAESNMSLGAEKDGSDIILTANPAA